MLHTFTKKKERDCDGITAAANTRVYYTNFEKELHLYIMFADFNIANLIFYKNTKRKERRRRRLNKKKTKKKNK